MNKENCALKLVDEIILHYDARSKKHQITAINSPPFPKGSSLCTHCLIQMSYSHTQRQPHTCHFTCNVASQTLPTYRTSRTIQLTNVQCELPLVCVGVNSNSQAPQFESINDRIDTQAISVNKSFMTKTKANARTDFCIGRETCPFLAPGRLAQPRVFFSSSPRHSSSSSYSSSSSIYEYTSWWVYRPQFPEQSVLPFSIFPASDLPSCIYDVPLTCILLLLFLFLLLLHGQDHCNTSFSTLSPLDRSTRPPI